MKLLILDTSSIIFGFSRKVDIFQRASYDVPGARVVLLAGVVRELQKLKGSKRKNAKYAKYALEIIKARGLKSLASEGNVDAWIMRNAEPRMHIVCTNDKELKRRLRSKGVRVVSLSAGGSLR